MALGWAVVLALLGILSGRVDSPVPCSLPEERHDVVFPAERFEQRAQQALILGRSI